MVADSHLETTMTHKEALVLTFERAVANNNGANISLKGCEILLDELTKPLYKVGVSVLLTNERGQLLLARLKNNSGARFNRFQISPCRGVTGITPCIPLHATLAARSCCLPGRGGSSRRFLPARH